MQKFEKFLNEHEVNEKLVVRQSPDGKQTLYFDHKRLIPFFGTASSGTATLAILFYWRDFLIRRALSSLMSSMRFTIPPLRRWCLNLF